MDGVAKSLERLKTDHIDLYQIHRTDPVTPVEETMRALDDLVRQGMVRYIGVSNWTAWRIAKANGIADKHGWNRIESLQAYYSIAGRDLERELVPLMQEEKIGCLVWSPLAGGYLSGKYQLRRRRRRSAKAGARHSIFRRWTRPGRRAGGGDAADRQGAWHVGGAGGAGLCAGQALGHQRDHRRAHRSAAGRQSGSGKLKLTADEIATAGRAIGIARRNIRDWMLDALRLTASAIVLHAANHAARASEEIIFAEQTAHVALPHTP